MYDCVCMRQTITENLLNAKLLKILLINCYLDYDIFMYIESYCCCINELAFACVNYCYAGTVD